MAVVSEGSELPLLLLLCPFNPVYFLTALFLKILSTIILPSYHYIQEISLSQFCMYFLLSPSTLCVLPIVTLI